MTTSGSDNFSVTALNIIERAYEALDALGIGETLSGDDYDLGLFWLNVMVKSWQAQGFHLWTETEGIVFTAPDQASYTLGGSNPDKSSSEDISTYLATDEATSSTVIGVDSTTGMNASDVIGIVLDDGTTHWTTIVSVDSSTQVTITSGLASAASTDNIVYVYTTVMVRPLDITSVRVQNDTGTETVLRKVARDDYFKLPLKTTTGTPTQFYFDRQRDHGKLYVYPTPTDGSYRLRVTFSRQIEDFDSSTNNPDFPIEWVETLILNLAVKLSIPLQRIDKGTAIAPVAAELLQGLKNWDSETSSFKVR